MLRNLNIEQFINETASKAPVPGGGSVAALTAALGAALSSMVFNITIGKKAYLELEQDKQELVCESLKKSDTFVHEFLDLMEMDAEVFQGLMKAFKLPKDTEEEINARKTEIKEASKKALQVPQNLAKKAEELYEIIETAVLYGNVNVISDAGVAAVLIHSSIESAIINVKINLNSVKEEELKKQIIEQNEQLLKQSFNHKQHILRIMEKNI